MLKKIRHNFSSLNFILPILFLVSFFLAPCFIFAQSSPKPINVTLGTVREALSSPTVDITGSAYFTQSSAVASESAGKVAKVYVNEGDIVSEGAILAKLDDTLLGFSVEAAKSREDMARLAVERAKRDSARNTSLFEQHAISEQRYQDSMTEHRSYEGAYAAARAEANHLKSQKDKMTIRAPFAGVITSKNIDVGEWVSAGGTVAGVAALSFEARVYAPERILEYIKVGQEVPVSTDTSEFAGKILSINPKGDVATRTFQVRVSLGSNKSFKEGMKVVIRFPSGRAASSLIVARDALVERGGQKGVFIVQDDVAKFIPVAVGGYVKTDVAISSPALKLNDKVIVGGNNMVNNGSKVAVGK